LNKHDKIIVLQITLSSLL